jgi:NAD(P)-dependent dehydrogenase (short-subunit alcohol dehydrogenase family)
MSFAAFAGGVAVITGAGSGIGEAFARTLADLGMTVVLADIDAGRIGRVAADIEAAGGTVLAVPTDVADPAAVDRLAAQTHDAFGDVRLLINNAGVETVGLIWEISAELWERSFRINVLGVINGVRAFVPRMLACGTPASIANVVSVGALAVFPVETLYIMSKHAVLSFTEGLYLELRMQGKPISVSAVMPGPVATNIFADAEGAGGAHAHHRAAMHDMLSAGMPPMEAARLSLAGVAQGDFWVSTHPELTLATARTRGAYLSNLALPDVAAGARAILGL